MEVFDIGKMTMKRSCPKTYFIALASIVALSSSAASKLNEVKIVDQDYIMIHFTDTEVMFVDDGLGSSAFGNGYDPTKNYVVTYGALNR